MSDLIDRSALPTMRIEIPERIDDKTCRILEAVIHGVQHVIDSAPAVDAVEVVRCKDCRWHRDSRFGFIVCKHFNHAVRADGYCNCGAKMHEGVNGDA